MKVLQWLIGMVVVQVPEHEIDRFLNLCRNRNLSLYYMVPLGKNQIFYMSLPDYLKIRPISRKLKILPLIIDRIGFPFLLSKWSRKNLFVSSCILSILLVYLLSQILWSIEVEGNRYYSQEAILEYLDENHVYPGMFYKNIDYRSIEELLRLAYKDISWVSLERKGTRLFVNLRESSATSMVKDILSEPAHLVASRNGIIESIITRRGTPMVKAGDTVRKGDILISGILTVVGDYDQIIANHPVRADGDVMLISERSYHSVFELSREKIQLIDRKRTFISLRLHKFQVDFFEFWKDKGENEIITTEEIVWKINDSLEFPVKITKTTYREYRIIPKIWSISEAKEYESKKFLNYLAQFEKKGVLILENDVKIEIDDSICVTKGKMKVSQLEEKRKRLKENEWREIKSDEYHGDDP